MILNVGDTNSMHTHTTHRERRKHWGIQLIQAQQTENQPMNQKEKREPADTGGEQWYTSHPLPLTHPVGVRHYAHVQLQSQVVLRGDWEARQADNEKLCPGETERPEPLIPSQPLSQQKSALKTLRGWFPQPAAATAKTQSLIDKQL